MKLYNYTPEQIKDLVRKDPMSARNLILGMQDVSNRMYDMITEMIKNIYGDTQDTCVLNLAYRTIPFGVPCMNEHDAYTIISHPVQLEQWRSTFYLKYGNLPIELVESSDLRIRFNVVRNKSKYWLDHDAYLRRKYEAIKDWKP
jgi:hypothetical protein